MIHKRMSERQRFTFSKADRLRKHPEFLELKQIGRQVRNDLFIAAAAAGNTGRSRLGVTVTRRVGGAVQRNRIKRLVREGFRRHGRFVKGTWDINVIAKRQAADAPSAAVFEALKELFERVSEIDN